MRANSLVFAIPIILSISLPLGLPPFLTEPAAGQEEPAPPDPTWQRLGLPESPTPESGGKDMQCNGGWPLAVGDGQRF